MVKVIKIYIIVKNVYLITFLKDDNISEKNCYQKCENYYYFDESNNYKCTNNNKCPEKYNKFIPLKNKCIDRCFNDNIYKYEYNNICHEQCPINTYPLIDNKYLCYDNPPEGNYLGVNESIYKKSFESCLNIENCISQILNERIQNGELLNKNEIFYDNNRIYQISTLEEQKLNNNLNVSIVDLGECEKILKEKEKLSERDNLILFKTDILYENLSYTYVQYKVYKV